MIDAAQRGQGIALANIRLVGDLLENGRLRRVELREAPKRRVELGGYYFIAREDRWMREATARFRNWLQRKLHEEADA